MRQTLEFVARMALIALLVVSGCGEEDGGKDEADAQSDAGNGDGDGDVPWDGDVPADGKVPADGDGPGDGDDGQGDGGSGGPECELDPSVVPTWRVLDIPIAGLGVEDINQQGPVAKGFTGVAYGNGVWVASVNSQGEDVIRWARSTDGETWEARSTPVPAGTTFTTSRIHFALGKFVYFGELKDQGSYAFTSSDGEDFTITKIGDGRLVLDEFAFSDELVIIAAHDADMRISTDLIHWTSTGVGPGTYTYLDIAYGDGRFLTSINGPGHVYTSLDGVTWETIEGLQSSRGYGLEYGNGFWLATGGPGSYHKSTNGVDFEQVASVSGMGSPAPKYVGDRFVGADVVYSEALRDKFTAVATLDGVTWSPFGETMVALPQGTTNVTYAFGELAYGDCKYVVAGNYAPAIAGATEQDPIRRPVLPLIIVGDVSAE